MTEVAGVAKAALASFSKYVASDSHDLKRKKSWFVAMCCDYSSSTHAPCLTRCWLCKGLRCLSGAFPKLEVGEAV
jgi:hypothetical protein